jgi:hypothetical protein
MRLLALAALVLLGAATAQAACAVGDLPCACAQAGGRWRDLRSPLEPTCTVTLKHQGERPRRPGARARLAARASPSRAARAPVCRPPPARPAPAARAAPARCSPTPALTAAPPPRPPKGVDRTFNIFFPKSYNPAKKYPVWVHLHGVRAARPPRTGGARAPGGRATGGRRAAAAARAPSAVRALDAPLSPTPPHPHCRRPLT